VLATVGMLPQVVASHFGASGAPNGWSSRPAYAALLVAVGAVLPLAVVGLVSTLSQRGPQRLNIPARQYWSRPENGAEAVRRVRAYMWWLGCIMTGFALVLHLLVVDANARVPPHLSTRGIVGLLSGFLLAIGLWIVGWYRLLRPAPGE
jgi:uncharacterized membrane protein